MKECLLNVPSAVSFVSSLDVDACEILAIFKHSIELLGVIFTLLLHLECPFLVMSSPLYPKLLFHFFFDFFGSGFTAYNHFSIDMAGGRTSNRRCCRTGCINMLRNYSLSRKFSRCRTGNRLNCVDLFLSVIK